MDNQQPNLQELKVKAVKGLSLLVAREFVLKCIVIAGQILLTKLLFPQDIGVVAIVIFIVGIAELFTDVGLSNSIIQRVEPPTKYILSSCFFLKLGITFITVLILLI